MAPPTTLRRKLVRIALGLAAGAVLVAIVGWLAVLRWLNAAGDPVDLATLAGPDTALALRWELRPDDPATVELVRSLVSRREATRPLPPAAHWLFARLGYDDAAAFVVGLLPIHMGVLMEVDGATLRYASFSHHANLVARQLDEQMRACGPPVGVAAGRPIHAEGAQFVAVWEHTLLVASTRARLESALAQLAGAPALDATTLLAKLPRDRPLAGALLDRGGFLARALDRARDERGMALGTELRRHLGLGAEHVDSVTLSATPRLADVPGELVIGLESTALPEHALRGMHTLLDEVARHFLAAGLRIEEQTAHSGDSIRVRFTVRDLEATWRAAIDK